MNKKIIKIISIIMCALMFLSTFSVIFTVFAAPTGEDKPAMSIESITGLKEENTTINNNSMGESANNAEPGNEVEIEKPSSVPVLTPESTESNDSETGDNSTGNLTGNVPESQTNSNNSSGTNTTGDLVLNVPEKSTVIMLGLNKDYGNLQITLSDTTSDKKYNVLLMYNSNYSGYVGTCMIPLGKYEISIEDKDDVEIKLKEKTIELRNYSEKVQLTPTKIKETGTSGFGNFLKNNILLLLLFFGAIIVYVTIKYKQQKLDK